ncbi:hypothetical protein ABB05_03345 [Lederbergia galactosidilytica]|uniref:DUF2515 domain-containing protein n=1 Tax=Lederbergia galactosidilytica TaxID=217031 RepID=A0A178A4X9_9BACI|nr:DUF2515 domain-containing protein [Lederbergia galactosidilytica]OAK74889.1 hypothetical protein ABB05_03345 [Lederbergia galactosidilytica]
MHCLKKKWSSQKITPELKAIKKELTKRFKVAIHVNQLNDAEYNLIEYIRHETKNRNVDNVTRTNAYLDFYKRFPEIHWAFLGHMVSRNGGWNMTDLKGDLLSRILSSEEQEQFFIFLERGNWLIFQDIYPQLLLYEESVKRNTNLFHLLPLFHVSFFMGAIWNYFFRSRDEYLLTIALIVNEQSYLEKRVIQNPYYQSTVLEKLEFKLQELLDLNQIIFPFFVRKEIQLIGQTIHQFASLHDRILLGKRLYELLFDPENYFSIYKWAIQQPHTGSRKDFWPHLFNDINESVPGHFYQRRIKSCRIKPNAPKIYSPILKFAWNHVDQKEVEKGDWYADWKVIHYLKKDMFKGNGAIDHEYCKTLERIEFAILAKETLLPKKSKY